MPSAVEIARGLFGGGASGVGAAVEGRQPEPAASVATWGSLWSRVFFVVRRDPNGHWFHLGKRGLDVSVGLARVDLLPFAVGSENGERETGVRDAEHRRSRRARSACP